MKDKYYFLLYPTFLAFFTPIHECGHAFIAWIFGVKVIRMDWHTCYLAANQGSELHWFLQDFYDIPVWQFVIAIGIVSLINFAYYKLKAWGIDLSYSHLKRTNIRFTFHPKE